MAVIHNVRVLDDDIKSLLSEPHWPIYCKALLDFFL